MSSRLEKTYAKLFAFTLSAINPFKEAILETKGTVHKFITVQGLEILKNDKFLDAYSFFSDFIAPLHEGVVWADLNLKSVGHFYSPSRERGLYGNRDALSLATEYYHDALDYWEKGETDMSVFYLGAAVHLVQDMTIPQHANIRLLDSHRQYENFIKRTYLDTPEFLAHRGGYYVESVEEAVRCNARTAIRIYNKLRNIEDEDRRFHTITKFTLPLAQKTTAGVLLRFYRDVGHKALMPD